MRHGWITNAKSVSRILLCASILEVASGYASDEKTKVFFVHGANVSEQNARVWASQMFKCLWQSGANMEFCPIAWESDIGPAYNYQVNASNAFATASRVVSCINQIPGRKVVIAHSLGTMVVAAAIQDYGLRQDRSTWTFVRLVSQRGQCRHGLYGV